MTKPRFAALLLIPFGGVAAALGLIWSGTAVRVTGVWVGGAAAVDAGSSVRTAASLGQPVAGPKQATASYTLRPGFVQSFVTRSSGGTADPAQDKAIVFTAPFGSVRVTVPAGAFSAPVTVTVAVPTSFPPASSRVARLNGAAVGVTVSVSPSLAPRKPIAVELGYRDADVQGLAESRLRLAVLPTGDDSWLPLQTAVDQSLNRASAAAPRLGTWQVMEVLPADSLGGIVAYPNPLAPGQGPMTFSNLPAGARLRIYTALGQLVRELAADDLGRCPWDGLNAHGAAVASGGYVVLVEGAGGGKIVRVQVQR